MTSIDGQQDEVTFHVCDPAPYPPPALESEELIEESTTSKQQNEEEKEEPSILDLQEKPTVIIRYG